MYSIDERDQEIFLKSIRSWNSHSKLLLIFLAVAGTLESILYFIGNATLIEFLSRGRIFLQLTLYAYLGGHVFAVYRGLKHINRRATEKPSNKISRLGMSIIAIYWIFTASIATVALQSTSGQLFWATTIGVLFNIAVVIALIKDIWDRKYGLGLKLSTILASILLVMNIVVLYIGSDGFQSVLAFGSVLIIVYSMQIFRET